MPDLMNVDIVIEIFLYYSMVLTKTTVFKPIWVVAIHRIGYSTNKLALLMPLEDSNTIRVMSSSRTSSCTSSRTLRVSSHRCFASFTLYLFLLI